VQIDMTGNEVVTAISAWLVAHGVYVQGPRTYFVNGDLISGGQVYVDPSGSVRKGSKTLLGRGANTKAEGLR